MDLDLFWRVEVWSLLFLFDALLVARFWLEFFSFLRFARSFDLSLFLVLILEPSPLLVIFHRWHNSFKEDSSFAVAFFFYSPL